MELQCSKGQLIPTKTDDNNNNHGETYFHMELSWTVPTYQSSDTMNALLNICSAHFVESQYNPTLHKSIGHSILLLQF